METMWEERRGSTEINPEDRGPGLLLWSPYHLWLLSKRLTREAMHHLEYARTDMET